MEFMNLFYKNEDKNIEIYIWLLLKQELKGLSLKFLIFKKV